MRTEIANFAQLLRTSWDQYKQRALPLLAVILISTVVVGGLFMVLMLGISMGGAMLAHFTDERTATWLVILLAGILLLVLIVLIFWVQTTLFVLVVKEELGIIEAFQAGWDYLWPMAWVLTLASGILISGFALGVLPGILFTVWFTFGMYVLLEEDRRGMEALLASREYVRGHWWNIFGKVLALWLLSAVVGLIPFIGQIFSLLFAPFFLLFLLAAYRDLKAVKGEAVVTAGSGTLAFWWFLAVAGLLLPLLAMGLAFFALLTGEQEWMQLPGPMHGRWL
jgi:hypothetical protein